MSSSASNLSSGVWVAQNCLASSGSSRLTTEKAVLSILADWTRFMVLSVSSPPMSVNVGQRPPSGLRAARAHAMILPRGAIEKPAEDAIGT